MREGPIPTCLWERSRGHRCETEVRSVHSRSSELAQNPEYELFQFEDREELFTRERETDPDLSLRDDCVRARDVVIYLLRKE
jgi:hypothetical protein